MGEPGGFGIRLAQRERELELLFEIDRIRDRTMDVNQLVTQATDVLAEALDVDLCMLGLAEEEDGRVVLKAVSDRLHVLSKLGREDICEVLNQAVALDVVSRLSSSQAFSILGVSKMLAAPLVVNGNRLGAFVLANQTKPFSASEIGLVQAVVSQMDSAVLHARTFRHAQERARQLEAIYRIDRIRDEAQGAREILSDVVHVATEALDVDLCLMSLINDCGESEIRAIEDRQGLFGQLQWRAVRQAMDWAEREKGVAVPRDGSPLAQWGLPHLVGAPLVVAGEQLGSMVLARSQRAFERADRDLVYAIVSQADSAVVHARAERRLLQRNKELETLYRVDRIRDQGLEFGEMLSAVLAELCTAIEAEMGFIMLFDYEGRQLELKASTADDILASVGHYHLIERAAGEALRTGELYAALDLSEWLHSIICVPLILRDRIIGVFGAVNLVHAEGCSDENRRLLLAITSQVDTAIFESLDKQRIRETFRRYVGPKVMEQMLATPETDFLKGERATLTVLFSDMRGFTGISERVPVDVLVEMINVHLGAMTEIVLAYGGTLDKFIGDEVVAIFGAPLYVQDHAIRAIRAALDMQAAQQALVARWAEGGYDLPPIGIGINTGDMVVGNIGCEQQMDYTAIGLEVNLARRLCDVAAGHQILVSEGTYSLVAGMIEANKLSRMALDGIQEPVQVYEITAVN
jgi:class 3 adenylate cyclase/nitrate/nitrite-specific signal transduction histidine kinase